MIESKTFILPTAAVSALEVREYYKSEDGEEYSEPETLIMYNRKIGYSKGATFVSQLGFLKGHSWKLTLWDQMTNVVVFTQDLTNSLIKEGEGTVLKRMYYPRIDRVGGYETDLERLLNTTPKAIHEENDEEVWDISSAMKTPSGLI